MKDSYEKQMIEMKREMKKNMEEAEQKHLVQLKEIQNRVITMERTQPPPPPRDFPAKPTWQRKNPNHEQRPPHQLEATNVVETYTPFVGHVKTFMKNLPAIMHAIFRSMVFQRVVVLNNHQASLST